MSEGCFGDENVILLICFYLLKCLTRGKHFKIIAGNCHLKYSSN